MHRATLTLLILAVAAVFEANAVTRLVFLGDSTTQGVNGTGAYRDPLIRIMRGETIGGANPNGTTYDIAVLGSLSLPFEQSDNSAFPNSLALYPNHEGHSGWTIDQIVNGHPSPTPGTGSGKLSEWIAAYPNAPDIVLVHLGSNDIVNQSSGPDFAANTRVELRAVVDTLRAAFPNVIVFLARIIPSAYTDEADRHVWVPATDAIITASAAVAAEANAAAGKTWVYTVDLNTGFNEQTMFATDGHPNLAGNDFMAVQWFNALKWVLDGQPAPPAPTPGPKRLLCLGDIIVQSGDGLLGFREPLTRLLTGENVGGANPAGRTFDVDFVGSHRTTYDFSPWNTEYPQALRARPKHEGHAGWPTAQILNGLPDAPLSTGFLKLSDWLHAYTADVVLLHLGTDDARTEIGNPDPNFVARERAEISAVLDALWADNPDVTVLLAKPVGNLYWSEPLETIVGLIDDIAAEKNASAPTPFVLTVDLNTDFDTATMLAGDGLRLNSNGETFAAAKWFNTLVPVLDGAPLSFQARSKVVNLSTRAFVGTDSDIVIPGFVISGQGSKRLLLRGVGPTLSDYGVSGVLAAPTMTLYSGSQAIASNTGWTTSADAAAIAQTAITVGAFELPANSADSALLVELSPGAYTVSFSGVGGTTGIGLMEIYEADNTITSARLVNISARALVGASADVLIPGYVISGSETRRLLIRAVGPGLAQFNVSGVLANPTLTVFSSAGTPIATNDNWGDSTNLVDLVAATIEVGAFDLAAGSLDAAALVTLGPGPYTVQVSGIGGTGGVALVEIYLLP